VGQRRALGVFDVLQQGAGGRDGEMGGFATEAGKVPGSELRGQQVEGRALVEIPRWQGLDAGAPGELRQVLPIFALQYLCRCDAFEFRGQRFASRDFHTQKSTTGELQPCDAEGLALLKQRAYQGLPALIEERVVGDGPRGNDTRHLTFHRSATGGRVANLLADGRRLAAAQQPGQIGLHGVGRHPGHGNRYAVGLAPGSQGNVEQARGLAGVVEKQLVEVPHAVEEQGLGVLCLDSQVLLDDRGVG